MKQLSGLDSVFLNLETPEAPMHVGAVTVLDLARAPKGFGFAAVRGRIAERLHLLPGLRRRLVTMPLNLIPPFWIEDPDFRLDRHVRRMKLQRPGGDHELAALAADLIAAPLERAQPLWMFYYVEGLSGRRAACISIIHHACVDGVSGAELLGRLLDSAQPVRPPAPAGDWDPDELPLALDRLLFTARQAWIRQRQFAQLVRQSLPLALRFGRAWLGQAPAPGQAAAAVPAGLPPAPHTRFNVAIDARRSYGFASLSLPRIRAVKGALRMTVNDVLLTLCAGALRSYLQERNELPAQPLVAAVPISVRTPRSGVAGGNQVTLLTAELPTHLAEPLARAGAVSLATARLKKVHRAVPARLLMDWMELPAPALVASAARLYQNFVNHDRVRPPVNLVISNIPGPQSPLFLAGAPLLGNYPISIPYHGLALNLTVLSYCDQLDVGVTAYAPALADPAHLLGLMEAALVELEAAAGLGDAGAPAVGAEGAAGPRPARSERKSGRMRSRRIRPPH
ncbi:MAG: wax ester/triacylglycerol synthase family O-acyltransferase [Nevskia sp.]|nr:wax ester/triacylglycerol synthase family O-acyltransferase [Nevskia sp.]